MNTRQIERRFESNHVNYLRDKWGYPMVQERSRWTPVAWLAFAIAVVAVLALVMS